MLESLFLVTAAVPKELLNHCKNKSDFMARWLNYYKTWQHG